MQRDAATTAAVTRPAVERRITFLQVNHRALSGVVRRAGASTLHSSAFSCWDNCVGGIRYCHAIEDRLSATRRDPTGAGR